MLFIICVLAEFYEYVSVHRYLILFSCYLLALQAVCCSDKQHCCPSGYTCDLSAGTCNKGEDTMSWNAMAVTNVMDRVSSNDVECPGGQQSCPDKTTCCLLQSGHYGCCRYAQVLITSLWNSNATTFNILCSLSGITFCCKEEIKLFF